MHKITKLVASILVFTIISFLSSCNADIDINAEKERIKSVMSSMREAHFKNSAAMFLEPMKDTFTEVRRGSYINLSKSASQAGIQSYFDSMEFLELADVQEPLVVISNDASLATYTGSIILKGYLNGNPVFRKLAFHSTLSKENGQWKIISNVNSTMPDSLNAPIVILQVQEKIGHVKDSLYIYAKANCSGPSGSFETLVISNSQFGRMEQTSSDGHIIIQHGPESAWLKDVSQGQLNEGFDADLASFVKGHEFHWLSLRPGDRFLNPVFEGYTKLGDKNAFKIIYKDDQQRDIVFYYDFASYKPLGFDYPSHQPGEIIRTRFLDWVELNDIQVFQSVRIDDGENIWEYDFTEIQLGPYDEARFILKEPNLQSP